MRTVLILFLLLLPLSINAAVTINEVAWMGGESSANHEWIELYNSGDTAMNLEGWTLGDGMNLEILLGGTLPATSYGVLERTSDESASGLAFLIYTGALVNTGATLTLRDATSGIVDQVAGGENWQSIGGDNVTKETAQYTTKGWMTDTPTPGALNGEGRTEEEVSSTSTSTILSTNSSAKTTTTENRTASRSEAVQLSVKDTVLKLKTDIQTVAYVNQTIPLSVIGSGIGDSIVDSLKYTWNFGDSYSATGRETKHAYAFPGTYVVTVQAAYARHNQVARHEITVLPTTFSITRNEAGDVQIHNDAPYDINLSEYVIQGVRSVSLPANTIMLPRSTITIASSRLEDTPRSSLVGLYDQARRLVASTYNAPTTSLKAEASVATREVSSSPLASHFSPAPVSAVSTSLVDNTPPLAFNFVAEAEAKVETGTFLLATASAPLLLSAESSEKSAVVATASPTETESESRQWPFLVFLGLLFIAFIALLIGPTQKVDKPL